MEPSEGQTTAMSAIDQVPASTTTTALETDSWRQPLLESYTKYISDEVLYWTEIIGYMGLHSTISTLGIVANTINAVVFIRQGVLSDSSTTSLFVLSLSDFLNLLTLLWTSICLMLAHIRPPDLPFDPRSMMYVSGARVHLMFVKMSAWITVYISFERCLCVVFPFKVRRLFTAQRTAILLPLMVLVIFFGGFFRYYLFEYLVWTNIPGENRSILVLYSEWSANGTFTGVDVSAILNALVAWPASLFLVMIFTQITVFRVNASRKWRKMTSSLASKGKKDKTQKPDRVNSDTNEENKPDDSNSSDKNPKGKTELGQREKRLAMMISVISVIFIVCMTPNMIFIVMEEIEPEIAATYKYKNLFFFNYSISFFLEGINGSINIFVYYNMSSKYKREFRKLFDMKE